MLKCILENTATYFSYEIVSSINLNEAGLVHLPYVSIAFVYNKRIAKCDVYNIPDRIYNMSNVRNITPFALN